MKKMMIIVAAMVLTVIAPATVNAGTKEDVDTYISTIENATAITSFDGSYEQELSYNACCGVDLDGEEVNMYAKGKVIKAYKLELEQTNELHVIFEMDKKLVDVNVDDEIGEYITID